MEVEYPLSKKKFDGGLYAVHTINMGDFHEWKWLMEWVQNNPDYKVKNLPVNNRKSI